MFNLARNDGYYGKFALFNMIDIYLDPDNNFAAIVAYNSKFE